MKTYYIYELINLYGTVEYVGETTDPAQRFKQHTKWKPVKGTGCGTFYGRQDLLLNIVADFADRKQAREYEGQLKLEYGLEWTEKTHCIDNGKKVGKLIRKLTNNQAQEIRSLYATGNYTQCKLAKIYKIAQPNISVLINKKTYVD